MNSQRHSVPCPHGQAVGCLMQSIQIKFSAPILFLSQIGRNYVYNMISLFFIVFLESCAIDQLIATQILPLNTLRPRQNGRHFPDDTFKRIFVNENVRISIKISLKFVPKGPINKIPAFV